MVSIICRKNKAIPGQVLTVPGVWSSQIARQSTCECGKVVSPTHQRPYPPVLISVGAWVKPLGHRATGWIISMKNSNYTFGNRTCHLPACSVVIQPTAPPGAHNVSRCNQIRNLFSLALNCIANSCIWNTCVTRQGIGYKLPEDDTIVSKHVGVW
jgi:hypothetical protein